MTDTHSFLPFSFVKAYAVTGTLFVGEWHRQELGEGCSVWQALASTRPGMPGAHPPNILVGGTSTGISPPQYYYVLSDIADQYWLTSVRSASSRFHSAIRRHQFASVRQEDSRLTRLVPPNLELALTPLMASNNNTDHATLSVYHYSCSSHIIIAYHYIIIVWFHASNL